MAAKKSSKKPAKKGTVKKSPTAGRVAKTGALKNSAAKKRAAKKTAVKKGAAKKGAAKRPAAKRTNPDPCPHGKYRPKCEIACGGCGHACLEHTTTDGCTADKDCGCSKFVV